MYSKGARKLPSIIDTYVELLEASNTPKRWRLWSALWLLSATVERRVWCTTMDDPVFPNLYIFLVGRSGGGKSNALKLASELIRSIGPDRTSASSMTAAFFAQTLQANSRAFINPIDNRGEPFHSVNVLSTELMTLFGEADVDMLAKLTELYDCGPYSEGRRKEEHTFSCDRTFTSMLGATTMTHLLGTFPQEMWSMGFMSRTIMVYDVPGERRSLFRMQHQTKDRRKIKESMKHDLKLIASIAGEFIFTPEAAEALDEFYTYRSPGGAQLGGPPIPDHPLLATYCERRHMHIEKIMMLFALDEGGDCLTLDHYERAYELLISTEADMPEVFKGAVEGSDLNLINELLYSMNALYIQKSQPVSETAMKKFLLKRTSEYASRGLIEMLINTTKIRKIKVEEKKKFNLPAGNYYIPLATTFEDTDSGMKEEG